MVWDLSSSEYSTMVGKNFQIYSVQIIGKCIWWNSIHLWDNLIISPTMEDNPPINFPHKICPPRKAFFGKKDLLPILYGVGDIMNGFSKVRLKAKGTTIVSKKYWKLRKSWNHKWNINRIDNGKLRCNCFQLLPTLRLKI